MCGNAFLHSTSLLNVMTLLAESSRKPIFTQVHSIQAPNSHGFSLTSQPSQGHDESPGSHEGCADG